MVRRVLETAQIVGNTISYFDRKKDHHMARQQPYSFVITYTEDDKTELVTEGTLLASSESQAKTKAILKTPQEYCADDKNENIEVFLRPFSNASL